MKWKQILETHKLQEIDNLNSPISLKEIELGVKNFPIEKTSGPDIFTGKFYQTSKKEIMLIIHKTLQQIKEGVLPKSFNETSIILYQYEIVQEKNTTDQYLS